MSGRTNGGRERSYQALHDSEELHRATLGSISDAVFLTNDSGAFTFICPNVDVIFGYSPDEVQAMERISSLLGEHLFDPAELAAKGEISNVEREVVSKSGEQRVVLVLLKRVAIQGGTILYACRDVTELKRAEKELAAIRLELTHAARLALIGELTASIAHEIQQPLTAILANAEVGGSLAASLGTTQELSELCEICGDIHQQCQTAAAIIGRLKTLASKRPLERKPLQLNDVVRDVLLLLSHDAQRRRVRLDADLGARLPSIEADRVALQQVLLNLIVNAMDAMDRDDTPNRHVIVRTLHAADAVEIAVIDTGHGIPPQAMPRLFEAFFTTKKEGVGLGLAITRSIVEAHAGRIWAEPRVEGGATFRVTLPVAPERFA